MTAFEKWVLSKPHCGFLAQHPSPILVLLVDVVLLLPPLVEVRAAHWVSGSF